MNNVQNILNNLKAEEVKELNTAEIQAAASAKKLNSNDVFGMMKNGKLRVITILGIAVGCASSEEDEKTAKELFYGLIQGELTESSVMSTVNRLHTLMQSSNDLLAAGVDDVELVDIVEDDTILGTYVLRNNKAYTLTMELIAEADVRLKDEYVKEYLTEQVKEYLLSDNEDDEYYDDEEDYDDFDEYEEDCE